jgi:hypothetical protein
LAAQLDPGAWGGLRSKVAKVFWFFFSKKNHLLSLPFWPGRFTLHL